MKRSRRKLICYYGAVIMIIFSLFAIAVLAIMRIITGTLCGILTFLLPPIVIFSLLFLAMHIGKEIKKGR